MIAAALRGRGRQPVHNRAGSNMTWGVATALLEQRGRRGPVRGRRGLAAAGRGRARPAPDRARQPLPRPARPLRRARAPRRRVGGAGRRAGRARPSFVAQRRRPADRRPRPRPRAAPAARASPTSGSRTRSQALPELQHAFDAKHCRRCGAPLRLRAGLRRAPRPLLAAPTAAPTGPRPDVAATRDRAARECAARGSPCARPEGELELRPAPPRPLQRLQRARGARPRRCGSGSRSSRRPRALGTMEAVFGRVETIEVAGKPVSILLIKNPAGANEVLRTLLLEAERDGDGRPRPLDRAQRPDRRRPRRLLGLGRRLRAARRARPPRRLRRHPGRRDGGAPQVRRAAAGGDRGRARRSTARWTAPSPRPTAGSSRCPPTPPCSSCAPCSPKRGPGEEVLGVSSAAVWHDVECGGYAADLPLWERAGGRRRRRRAGARLRDGPGRPAPGAPRHARSGRSTPTVAARGAQRAGGGASGLPVRAVCADVRALELDREFELIIAPMQLLQMLGGAAARRAAAGASGRAPRARGPPRGRDRRAPGRLAGRRRRRASRRARARRLGLLEPSGRASAPTAAASRSAGCARRSRPTAR